MHDPEAQEFTAEEYCLLDGNKGDWKSTDMVMYHLSLASCDDSRRFSMYDVILNPVKCFKELQKELRAGKRNSLPQPTR